MKQDKVKVGILGASGYGGGELLRRLAKHPLVEISGVGSRKYEGKPLHACWPQFGGLLELTFRPQEEVIAGCEVLFTATPHGATAPLVKAALDAGKRVVDLSADFRLSAEDYPRWYGHPHPCPELLPQAVYGLSELHREEVRGARLVANPGCNATAASLALAPLAACNMLGEDIIINIAAAVSGAGRKPDVGLHYGEVNENAKPYKVAGTHRHIPEIEATLGRLASIGRRVHTHATFERPVITFTPHLIPMTRGILATCTTRLERELEPARLLALYRDFYQGEPVTFVQDELPQTKATSGTDRCLISVRYDARSHQVLAFAALDNLGKGAAGQAVQNFNLMLGLEETLGLETQAVWP